MYEHIPEHPVCSGCSCPWNSLVAVLHMGLYRCLQSTWRTYKLQKKENILISHRMNSKYLLYTLVNYRNMHYIAMFKQFLLALSTFSNTSKFDLCVILDANTMPAVQKLPSHIIFR